jgi:Tetratricopeptide repeat
VGWILALLLSAQLDRVNALAAQKQFAEAERVAREALAREPGSRDARLALANVLLWTRRYAEARREYAALLRRNASDADARLGVAQAEYWSGDYRRALRDFRLVQQRAEAQRAIAEIAAASRPGYVARAEALHDDQPYHAATAAVSLYAFSDPLTRWQLTLTPERRNGRDTPQVRAGVETTLLPVTIGASLARQRFGDDTTRTLAAASLRWRLLTLSAAREPLLRTLAGLRTHPTADAISLRWGNERYAIHAESLRYFDRNRGSDVDAFVLQPFGALALGASVAYRDTRESRFAGGVYDPYYTPAQQREARAIAAFAAHGIGIHLDAGFGHDAIAGSFHPWRAAVSYTYSRFTIAAEHNSTAFYNSNEIHASVAGRF